MIKLYLAAVKERGRKVDNLAHFLLRLYLPTSISVSTCNYVLRRSEEGIDPQGGKWSGQLGGGGDIGYNRVM